MKFNRFALAGAALAAAITSAVALGGQAQATTYPAKGIDVSSFQHPNKAAINWKSVRSGGYTFAFIKDTEGTYYVNPYYASDLKAARAAGISASPYAYANPHQSTGTQEADYLVNHGGGTGVPILDIEEPPAGYASTYGSGKCFGKTAGQLATWISQFDSEIDKRIGYYPSINTTVAFWNTCMSGSSAFDARWLWVGNDGSSPVLPKGWKSWHWWQDSITGRVSGVSGNVDIDVLY